MSGGHFDYRESYLEYIAEQLAQDIQYNDDEYDISRSPDEPHGFQHRPETIRYLELMVNELFRLKDLLKTYDYAVSGDSSEEEFLILARQAFSTRHKK